MKDDLQDFGKRTFVTHTTGLKERIQKAEEKEKRQMIEQELLAVLDMSEDEQFKWLMDNNIVTNEYVKCSRHLILADLAFRLRDELWKESCGVCEKYHRGLEAIYNHYYKNVETVSFYAWQEYQIKPIDIIIAALIAHL